MAVQGRTGRLRTSAALLAVSTVAAGLVGCSSDEQGLTTPDGSTISKPTTRIAQVNIVNAERDFDLTCMAPTAPDPGVTDVQRIVVTDPALLDAVCALGIGPKVVAVAAEPGSIPEHLGPQLSGVPTIGERPGAAAVAEANPDVVLSDATLDGPAAAFDDARIVPIGPGDWRATFTAVADALGRSAAAARLLDEFSAEVTRAGEQLDARRTQVSLVRFAADGQQIAGTNTFAGQILAEMGVTRPAPQRSADSFALADDDLADADADLIYVSFTDESGLNYGEEMLRSDEWLDLGAAGWNRVLSINDEIWYRSPGLAAAWLVLNDVKGSLNGFS